MNTGLETAPPPFILYVTAYLHVFIQQMGNSNLDRPTDTEILTNKQKMSKKEKKEEQCDKTFREKI